MAHRGQVQNRYLLQSICISFILLVAVFQYTTQNYKTKIWFKQHQSYEKRQVSAVAKKQEEISKPVCPYKWRISELPRFDEYEIKKDNKQSKRKNAPKWLYKNPKYKLDQKRFLLTLMRRGPNNQLCELKNLILMAIVLNRTVVVPQFYPHFTDEDLEKNSSINPLHRVNVASMCQLVSCVHLDDFREYCDNEIDVIMEQPGNIEPFSPSMLYNHAKMYKKNNLLVLPRKQKGRSEKGYTIDDTQQMYNSERSCALVPLYFSNNMESTQKVQDLANEIDKASDLPPYIHQIAEDFIDEAVGGKPFISVHWRYNKIDFQRRCDESFKRKVTNRFKKTCRFLNTLTPANISDTLLEFAQNRAKDANVKVFYIATPPSEIPVITEVAKIMKKKGFTILSQTDLDNYVAKQNLFSLCPSLEPLYFDIQSNVEMAICTRGEVFVKSTPSSWSHNVVIFRRIRGMSLNHFTVLQLLGLEEYLNNT